MSTKVTLVEVPEWKGKLSFGSNHSYWWNEKGKEPRPLSGVTSVLNIIAKPALIPWAVKMAIDFIDVRVQQSLLLVKNSQGTGGFFGGEAMVLKTVQGWLPGAKKAHTVKKDTASDLGKDAHALIEEYIKSHIEHDGGIPSDQLTSQEPRVREFAVWARARHAQTSFRFIASEVPLADPKLSIAGTPDFIAEELDENGHWVIVIGDLKTGSGIYDRVYFAQMAAYGYMWNRWKKRKGTPKLVIVHAPASKPEQPIAEYWSDDFKGDWEAFKAALTLHRWKDNFTRPNY